MKCSRVVQYYPDNPVLEWTEAELGRAKFYYDRKLNERFLSVTTSGVVVSSRHLPQGWPPVADSPLTGQNHRLPRTQ